MSLKEKLKSDLIDAMKSKDSLKKDAVQGIRAAILQIEKDKKIELDETGVLEVVASQLKKYSDVLPEYQKSGREDLINELTRRIEIIKTYLPEQLSVDEIDTIVKDAISQIGATSMKDMGKVMGIVSAKTKGRADGKTVSEIVKNNLQ